MNHGTMEEAEWSEESSFLLHNGVDLPGEKMAREHNMGRRQATEAV